jgi:hypothetical protein
MANEEKQTEKKTGDLFSSIGALVGMVASGGNPMGAALGSGLGSLLSGGSMQDAFQSGIGSFLTGSTMGKAGLALNMLGGSSPQSQGAGFLGMFAADQGRQRAMQNAAMGAVRGGPTGAVQGIMQAAGIQNAQGQMDPIMGGLLREMLNQQRRPRFENVMSDLEMQQYATGERRPDYRGTPTPDAPRVSYRPRQMAMGGFVEGPGTGKSDSIPAAIYQNGGRVQEARLSDGEFVMTADAVKGAGGGNRNAGAAKMYQMMNQFERMA